MKLASHNSLSYLPPKNFFSRIFRFCGKCQENDIATQYFFGDVLYFDVRFKVSEDREVTICHGSCDFQGNLFDILRNFHEQLGMWGQETDVHIRILCEDGKNKEKFRSVCGLLKTIYPGFKFYGGRNKKTWEIWYDFGNPEPKILDKYASWGHKKLWINKLLGVFPRLYSWIMNKKILREYQETDQIIMMDFI